MGWLDKFQDGENITQIPEVTVYGKAKYNKLLAENEAKKAKFLEEIGKYKKDSVQWANANKSYQDSLTNYNSWVKDNKLTLEASVPTNEKNIGYPKKLTLSQKNELADKLGLSNGLVVNNPKDLRLKAYQDSVHLYNQGIAGLESLKDGTYSPDVAAYPNPKFRDTDRFDPKTRPEFTGQPLPIGYYVSGDGKYDDVTKRYEGKLGQTWGYTPFYKKPVSPVVYELDNPNDEWWQVGSGGIKGMKTPKGKPTNKPIQPISPIDSSSVIKYDPKYEDLKMRSLWANIAKQDTSARIGVLDPLDYNDPNKGFTINQARNFPQEVKDQYGLNYINSNILPKYQNGGNMQEHQPNFNDSHVSIPPNFEGVGHLTTGRKWSPAWGGQFENGGLIPKDIELQHIRNGAPSEGKHAKKTMPSAEKGMTFYQHGLDWKPKNISKNGSELKKLDQLTNFSNYNKPTKGGWLDKY